MFWIITQSRLYFSMPSTSCPTSDPYKAGLVSDSDINLNLLRNANDTWPSSLATLKPYHILLLTRCIVHDEITSIFYSTNRFFIRFRDSQNPQALQKLTPDSLSSLTHLTIHVNISSFEVNAPCCNVHPGKSESCHQHDRPLRISSGR